ncbi:hypothetical protein [Francisella frigiditurris]|uniref:Uncharacterized protein n=1 Tax=Francisella frigiditurris TaxID=1542390 RepID=A0A1J0KW43_9GAMM|nr:hypothetical protein [Francisella frigiditurris]APC97830.1 hypothetical protein KX01_136 [Francisella frigiditurris]
MLFQKKLIALIIIIISIGLSLETIIAAHHYEASPLDIVKNEKNNPLGHKPYAQVLITANECHNYQVLINDFPIYSDNNTEGTIIPINPYISNGTNTFSITSENGSYREDKICKVSVIFQIKSTDQKDSEALEITKLVFNGYPTESIKESSEKELLGFNGTSFEKDTNGYILVSRPRFQHGDFYYGYNNETKKREYMPGTKISQNVKLPIDLKDWKWLHRAVKIQNDSQTKKEIMAIYKEIWADIHRGDWSKLEKIFASKDRKLSEVYYTKIDTSNEIKNEINSGHYVKELNDETIKNDVFINIYGEGYVAEATFANGDNILQFNAPSGTASNSYNVIFAKIDGEFKVVR